METLLQTMSPILICLRDGLKKLYTYVAAAADFFGSGTNKYTKTSTLHIKVSKLHAG